MKRFIAFSAVALILVAAFTTTSCSTAKSINSAFEKNGYIMGTITPQQQAQMVSFLSAIPALNSNAIGYLTSDKAVTFVYQLDESAWSTYANSLVNAGFSNMGIGLVRADKNAGITYNVSGKTTTVYKQPCLLVTYTYSTF